MKSTHFFLASLWFLSTRSHLLCVISFAVSTWFGLLPSIAQAVHRAERPTPSPANIVFQFMATKTFQLAKFETPSDVPVALDAGGVVKVDAFRPWIGSRFKPIGKCRLN